MYNNTAIGYRMLSSDRDMSRKCRILLNLLFLLFFVIFVAQSFHIAVTILVTFAIFGKFANSSISISDSRFLYIFFAKIAKRTCQQIFANKIDPGHRRSLGSLILIHRRAPTSHSQDSHLPGAAWSHCLLTIELFLKKTCLICGTKKCAYKTVIARVCNRERLFKLKPHYKRVSAPPKY